MQQGLLQQGMEMKRLTGSILSAGIALLPLAAAAETFQQYLYRGAVIRRDHLRRNM